MNLPADKTPRVLSRAYGPSGQNPFYHVVHDAAESSLPPSISVRPHSANVCGTRMRPLEQLEKQKPQHFLATPPAGVYVVRAIAADGTDYRSKKVRNESHKVQVYMCFAALRRPRARSAGATIMLMTQHAGSGLPWQAVPRPLTRSSYAKVGSRVGRRYCRHCHRRGGSHPFDQGCPARGCSRRR